jgi:4-diphosphocytidyl-2-C-methyl-D-erythritol kinase
MKTDTITLPSFAKINLFLRILGKRPDSYHRIFTAFQTVSLCDRLTFSKSDELSLTCDDERLPTGRDNLILKAAEALREKTKTAAGAEIRLEKKIPFPGGLGGGSSNAAIALLGLATLWDLSVSYGELSAIGAAIGSDIPFFFHGGTAYGAGTGTEIIPTADFKAAHILIVTPDIEISTAAAYRQMNAQDLTNIDSKSILKICRDEAERLESGHLNFTNDFERTVFEMAPEIKRISRKLADAGAETVLLSGSGASVFAIFDNNQRRQFALDSFGEDLNSRRFAVKTVSRQEYREHLSPCKHLLPKNSDKFIGA